MLLLFCQSDTFSIREPRPSRACGARVDADHADRTAGMEVARLVQSSRSWHECDDRVERFNLIRDGMWVHAITVEQLVAACNLARERCALAEVPSLRRVVRTREARFEWSIAFRSQENYIQTGYLRTACVLYRTVWYRCHGVVCGMSSCRAKRFENWPVGRIFP